MKELQKKSYTNVLIEMDAATTLAKKIDNCQNPAKQTLLGTTPGKKD